MAVHFASGTRALIIVCCSAIMLSGCARMGALSRVDPLSVAIYPGGGNTSERPAGATPRTDDCPLVAGVNSYSSGAVNLDCFMFPEDRPRNESSLSDREQWNLREQEEAPSNAAGSATTRQPPVRATRSTGHTTGPLAYSRAVRSPRERNRLAALLLKHSDDICVEEMGRLNSNESAVNTSLSILATAATTTSNIVTGELAQSILTGVGTLAGASRSHIAAHVYRNTFAYAVSRAITLERQRLRAQHEARRGQNTTLYTVDEAIRAVNEYHGVCSFYKGLELVLASVEGDQRSRDAQMRLAQISAIEQQIREQRAAMADLKPEDRAAYVTRINRLEDQKQGLVLAGAQLPDEQRADQTTTTTTTTTTPTTATTPTTPTTTTPGTSNPDDEDDDDPA